MKQTDKLKQEKKTPQGDCRGARKKRKQGAEVYVQEGKIDKRGVDDETRRDEWRGERREETYVEAER